MNTPKIRFKGFKDDWEQRKLKNLIEEYKETVDSSCALPILTSSKTEGVILQEEHFGRKQNHDITGYNILPRNYCTYRNRSDGVDFTFNINKCCDKGIISKFYPVFCGKENDTFFISLVLNNSDEVVREIGYTCTGTGQKVLSFLDLQKMHLRVPTSNEQKKIAGFFTGLDDLITLHQRKCDETKQLKKFMLQKMFPKNGEKNPEIRFEGFTDDWEQRKLGEVCEIKDSARIPNSEWSESGVPYIRASDVTNENTDGVLFISQERYEFYKNRTGAPTKDDVLFNGGGEIGKSLLITDEKPIYVQGGAVLYAQTSKSRELVGQYLKTYFETTNAKSYIDAASAGGTMRHFTLKPSQIMRILMPSVEEQEKIGEYFANLDQLITLHQRKCEKIKELKKFMLQNMFV